MDNSIYVDLNNKHYEYKKIDSEQIEKNVQKAKILKINLLKNKREYENSVGESIWVCATSEKDYKKLINLTSNDEKIVVAAIEGSALYKSIKAGTYLLVETRGIKRAVGYYDDLMYKLVKRKKG